MLVLGMVLGTDDKGLYAVSVMEDQPAFKAGIKPGDHIIAIDGQSTSEIPVRGSIFSYSLVRQVPLYL